MRPMIGPIRSVIYAACLFSEMVVSVRAIERMINPSICIQTPNNWKSLRGSTKIFLQRVIKSQIRHIIRPIIIKGVFNKNFIACSRFMVCVKGVPNQFISIILLFGLKVKTSLYGLLFYEF